MKGETMSANMSENMSINMSEKSGVNADIQGKFKKLKDDLRNMKSVAVAFSSGVDSTFLVKVAHDVLGDNMIAVTASSSMFPGRERKEAEAFCAKEGIRHVVCDFQELKIKGFAENPPNRCYLCKRQLFTEIQKIASEHNMNYTVEGSNMDDRGDYRPGLIAIQELNVKSPLYEAGFYKEEIRRLSREMGLPTWEKPSFACLASRFVYGEDITEEKLKMVELAEELLFEQGFYQARVRIHDKMARIEVMPEQFEMLVRRDIREEIVSKFKDYGFTYVSMDLTGYRTGSMNETLKEATGR